VIALRERIGSVAAAWLHDARLSEIYNETYRANAATMTTMSNKTDRNDACMQTMRTDWLRQGASQDPSVSAVTLASGSAPCRADGDALDR